MLGRWVMRVHLGQEDGEPLNPFPPFKIFSTTQQLSTTQGMCLGSAFEAWPVPRVLAFQGRIKMVICGKMGTGSSPNSSPSDPNAPRGRGY